MYCLTVPVWASCVACCLGLLLSPSLIAQEWTRFRNADGSGVTSTTNLPVRWSETENLLWKYDLSGYGSSTPILTAGKLLVTYSTGYGAGLGDDQSQLTNHLLCLDQASGKLLWDESTPVVAEERPYQGFVQEHGYASATPVTDGAVVYAFFGVSGVFAFHLDGSKFWPEPVSLGTQTHNFGSGASPIVFENLLIVNAGVESNALYGLDKITGKEMWKVEGIHMSWSTPLIVPVDGQTPELVLNMKDQMVAYDPRSGERLWHCDGIPDYICPSVIAHEGIVYGIGGRKSKCLAVRAGGRGDVTESHRLWMSDVGSNVPSPVYVNGNLHWVDHRGIGYVVDARTGETVKEFRVTGAGKTYASTTAADGKLYMTSRDGGAFVFEATPEMPQLANNKFASDSTVFNASPVIDEQRIYLRSDQAVYCVGIR